MTWGLNDIGASGGNATRTNFENGQWFLQPSNGIASLRANSLEVSVPEPAGVALMAIALAALVVIRRRVNAKAQAK
jgi:hypothetical protein